MKRVGLECGGKSPQVFMDDLPDLDAAVAAAVDGIFSNSGQSATPVLGYCWTNAYTMILSVALSP